MSDIADPHKDVDKTEKNSQFTDGGIFVREDDQDWGSSGMNDIKGSE